MPWRLQPSRWWARVATNWRCACWRSGEDHFYDQKRLLNVADLLDYFVIPKRLLPRFRECPLADVSAAGLSGTDVEAWDPPRANADESTWAETPAST